jgi:glucose/arabinose dehydrogenase
MRANKLLILISTFALLIAAAYGWQQQAKVSLPPPYATKSVNNGPEVVSKPAGAELKVPAGFSVDVWASGFEKPRFLLQGNSGEILLADSAEGNLVEQKVPILGRDHGTIYVFPNGDPSKRKKLITGLDRPYGLALLKQYLYVGEPAGVKRYTYDPKSFTATNPAQIISWKGFDKKGHWTRSLLFDRAGQKLYVGVGSGSNVDAGEPRQRAAINRYNVDGTGEEQFASGTRNPIAIHWYPGTEVLWATVQERDALGDDLVPDYFTHIEQGKFYGWPYAYAGPNEDPRRKGERPELVAKTIPGDVMLGSHVAVLDFTFYTGNQFPKEYSGGAFLAEHGSWNRSKRVGYKVVFVPFQNGKPVGEPKDFLTGWMTNPDRKEVWGRPVAVFQQQDGSLLISDDGGQKIWRVRYTGKAS